MATSRKIRVEYPGAIYHIMSRGNRRGDIYLDDVDRHDFIKTLAEACQKTGWQVHAYCLMRNHYHLVRAKLLAPADRLLAYPWSSLGLYLDHTPCAHQSCSQTNRTGYKPVPGKAVSERSTDRSAVHKPQFHTENVHFWTVFPGCCHQQSTINEEPAKNCTRIASGNLCTPHYQLASNRSRIRISP